MQTRNYLGTDYKLQVLQSNAGYYIGTFGDEGPVSRESQEYYSHRAAAEYALLHNTFTQRVNP